MQAAIKDYKNKAVFGFFNRLNHIVVLNHFRRVEIIGAQHIPRRGPFLLVSNHSSRWDGLVIFHMLNRPANYMVSPNELVGLQGLILKANGGFPANGRLPFMDFVLQQVKKNEPIVIFPEGDIYRDGTTRRLKKGAAQIFLNCVRNGVRLPIVPVAIRYEKQSAWLEVLEPLCPLEKIAADQEDHTEQINHLSSMMYQYICQAREMLKQRCGLVSSGQMEMAS